MSRGRARARRPRLLDLFCGEGGAGMGYARAGFDVVGVDCRPQPRYPFRFVQGDALAFLEAHGHEFDAIHASPPCQRYSILGNLTGSAERHPDLVGPVRALLRRIGRPWIMENVPGAPLQNAVMLCGEYFGLRVYRHRLFESSVVLLVPPHERHRGGSIKADDILAPNRRGRSRINPANPGGMRCLVGHFGDVEDARAAIGMPWASQRGISQAIPPAYTEFLGAQLLAVVASAERVA